MFGRRTAQAEAPTAPVQPARAVKPAPKLEAKPVKTDAKPGEKLVHPVE